MLTFQFLIIRCFAYNQSYFRGPYGNRIEFFLQSPCPKAVNIYDPVKRYHSSIAAETMPFYSILSKLTSNPSSFHFSRALVLQDSNPPS